MTDGNSPPTVQAITKPATRISSDKSPKSPSPPAEDSSRLLHELQVHKIELEMQNQELHNDQRALLKTTEKWHKVFHLIPDPIAILDADQRVIETNQAFEQLLKKSSAEIKGQPCFALIHQTTQPIATCPLHQPLTEASHTCAEFHEASMNKYFRVSIIPLGSRKTIHLFHDITATRQQQENFLQSRNQLEAAVAERTTELVMLNTQLKKLSVEQMSAVEEERKLIARELHDHLGQSLLLAKLKLDSLNKEQDPSPLRTALDDVGQLIGKTVADLRAFTLKIQPPVLSAQGFSSLLKDICATISGDYDLHIKFACAPQSIILSPELTTCLCRATRELLINVAKHAGTCHATINITTEDNWLNLVVADQGVGFKSSRLSSHKSFGYRSIFEGVELAGGKVVLDTAPGKGTCVTLSVPLEEPPLLMGENDLIRVLLVDDHALLRLGLRQIIESHQVAQVVGEADNGREALDLASELRPDLVIMDLIMPEMNGIDATRELIKRYPGIKVLILSMATDRAPVVESLKAGAMGYLLKDSMFSDLEQAIEVISQGDTYLSKTISNLLLTEYLQCIPKEEDPVYTKLSPREREILQLIAEGKNVKQIAAQHNCSNKTVDNQRLKIMQKLNLFSIAELTKYAIQQGLISLSDENPPA